MISPSMKRKLRALQPLAARALARMDRSVVLAPTDREPPPHLCRKCGQEWPRTEEFFYRGVDGRYNSPCIACQREQKQEAAAHKPCAYPGCNAPRYKTKSGKYTSYCAGHQWHKVKRLERERVQP